eukprot:EG_transcript_9335
MAPPVPWHPPIGCVLLLLALLQLSGTPVGNSSQGEWVFQQPTTNSYLAAWAHSPLRHPTADLEFLRGLSVVFMGDSVTRYQFMFLVQFLHLRQWDGVLGNDLCNEKRYETYTNMYRAYWGVFGCSHICDCADHHVVAESLKGNHSKPERRYQAMTRNENHYFFHSPLQARFSFHMWTGTAVKMTSYRHTPSEAEFVEYCRGFPATAHTHLTAPLDPKYTFPNGTDFIRDVLAPEGHDVLIFNYGIWRILALERNAGLFSEEYLDAFAKAAHEAAPIVVWKTTTAVPGFPPLDDDALLAGLRRRGFHIFDAYALTRDVIQLKDAAMFDGMHFKDFVNREVSIAFLDFLHGLVGPKYRKRKDTSSRAPHLGWEHGGLGPGQDQHHP